MTEQAGSKTHHVLCKLMPCNLRATSKLNYMFGEAPLYRPLLNLRKYSRVTDNGDNSIRDSVQAMDTFSVILLLTLQRKAEGNPYRHLQSIL